MMTPNDVREWVLDHIESLKKKLPKKCTGRQLARVVFEELKEQLEGRMLDFTYFEKILYAKNAQWIIDETGQQRFWQLALYLMDIEPVSRQSGSVNDKILELLDKKASKKKATKKK